MAVARSVEGAGSAGHRRLEAAVLGDDVVRQDAAVCAPNAPNARQRGSVRKAQAGGGPGLHDVLSAVDYAVEIGLSDPERLVVGGWSCASLF